MGKLGFRQGMERQHSLMGLGSWDLERKQKNKAHSRDLGILGFRQGVKEKRSLTTLGKLGIREELKDDAHSQNSGSWDPDRE